MEKLKYHLLDVFTNRPFDGNQLAVFTNGSGVSSEMMPAIAKELNLSETTLSCITLQLCVNSVPSY